MPRQPRIQFPGAIYHVMARGNCRGPIVLDDKDRRRFVETLSEACEKSAWEVYAWVLLDNHYHLALRTPAGNLVEGMKWFQNTRGGTSDSTRAKWANCPEAICAAPRLAGRSTGKVVCHLPLGWIAQQLNLSSAANASQQIRRFANRKPSTLPKEIRQWRKICQ